LYKTSSATLNGGCSGASCWPAKRAVASSTTGDFLDKEWMDVGQSGSNTVVWVTWTRFTATASPIEASRCTADLSSCTSPIPISASNAAAQFSYVTIAPNGKVYVTWIEASSGLGGEVFTLKMRVAAAGSTTFGGVITLATETQPLGFNTSLADNDFRIVSIPQNTVLDMGTTNRVYVVWPFCQQAILVGTCRDSDIKIAYTDNDGSSFTTTTLTAPGNQYFPGIDADNSGGRIYLTYYSNRLDPWNHRQQVVLAHAPPDLSSFSFIDLNPVFARGDLNCDGTFNVIDIIRALQDLAAITPLPLNCPNDLNEPDADPFLGGLFIGDYIEVFAHNNLAVIGYNANFTLLNYLGTGPATYQQDNYLAKFTYP
ncbi:MAG TPA: hypothetical protein VNL15_05470, partial [Dehalococcoidia bacterium]|nr:hypothetical protein [Dehalococcoidia bacterium]